MNTDELTALLRERFSAPEHAILFEVANGTGATHRTYTDAVVMSLFPSRGLTLHGIEMKVSRGDWLRELKKPEKADEVFRFMDSWWIVAGDDKIVKDGELPPTWGLLVAEDGKLVQRVKAPTLEPAPITRPFLAALLRRASEAEHRAAVLPGKHALEKARHDGWEEGRASGAKDANRHTAERLAESLEDVAAFERASGLELKRHSSWNRHNERLGEAVKRVLAGDEAAKDLRRVRDAAANLVEAIDTSAQGASVSA